MAFVTSENGYIVSDMLRRNSLAGVVTNDGKVINIYDDDFEDLLISMPAEGGERMLIDFVHMYEYGVEAGKRKKAYEIRDALGC